MYDLKKFFWDEPYLYRSCADRLIRRCVPECEMLSVLEACHSSPVGGHHSGIRTAHKILQCGYSWPTLHQDAHGFAKACDRCQRDGSISIKQELPLNPILVIELFDVWGIDFMGLFVSSHRLLGEIHRVHSTNLTVALQSLQSIFNFFIAHMAL